MARFDEAEHSRDANGQFAKKGLSPIGAGTGFRIVVTLGVIGVFSVGGLAFDVGGIREAFRPPTSMGQRSHIKAEVETRSGKMEVSVDFRAIKVAVKPSKKHKKVVKVSVELPMNQRSASGYLADNKY